MICRPIGRNDFTSGRALRSCVDRQRQLIFRMHTLTMCRAERLAFGTSSIKAMTFFSPSARAPGQEGFNEQRDRIVTTHSQRPKSLSQLFNLGIKAPAIVTTAEKLAGRE
jgi:hypothetical protein